MYMHIYIYLYLRPLFATFFTHAPTNCPETIHIYYFIYVYPFLHLDIRVGVKQNLMVLFVEAERKIFLLFMKEK